MIEKKEFKSLKHWRRGAEFPGSGDIRGVLTGFGMSTPPGTLEQKVTTLI